MTIQHDDYDVTPRLRRDGSIDTDYYTRRSRKLRSEQAYALAGVTTAHSPRRQGWLAGLFSFPSRRSA